MESCQSMQYAMGTVMSHKIFGSRAGDCLLSIQGEVSRLEKALSRFLPESDVSRINQSAGIRREPVCRETLDLLTQAVHYSHQCQGCFDITIGPLVDLWNRGKKAGIPPEESVIEEALPLVNYLDLELDAKNSFTGLVQKGQSIDLGGIGKGYAGDRLMDIFHEFGVKSAYSNLGGHVVTVGAKPDGSPWHIGIQHPRRDNELIGSVAVTGQNVVTSGDYQRYFKDHQGICHHHILDPLTGHPSDSDVISVTVVSEESTEADAFSTILFIAGVERGLEIVNEHTGIDAIFVDRDLHVFVTQGLEDSFQVSEGFEKMVISKEIAG